MFHSDSGDQFRQNLLWLLQGMTPLLYQNRQYMITKIIDIIQYNQFCYVIYLGCSGRLLRVGTCSWLPPVLFVLLNDKILSFIGKPFGLGKA